jgi:endo-alpha-1,4-polygalactosaminidase (GH114 family)
MIGRRAFALGAASLLASASARAADMPAMPKAKKRRADIPFTPLEKIPNHRQFMRDIVVALADYAKKRNPRFVILARNAPGLLVKETREWKWETLRDPDHAEQYPKVGTVNRTYLKAIDGLLIDGLTYGVPDYGKPTDPEIVKPLQAAGAAIRDDGRRLLSIDYCDTKAAIVEAETKAAKAGALAYIDRDGNRDLGRLPRELPRHENAARVTDIVQARNYLPMLRSDTYGSRADWVDALAATNYDLLILDTFWRGTDSLAFDQIKKLKYKRLGSDRLIFGMLPLALARDTRFYWKPEWKLGNPSFLAAHDPDDPAETIVNYWDPKWKELIGQYMQGIVDLGVDGVLLDQLDAYLYFEDLMPLE